MQGGGPGDGAMGIVKWMKEVGTDAFSYWTKSLLAREGVAWAAVRTTSFPLLFPEGVKPEGEVLLMRLAGEELRGLVDESMPIIRSW